MSNLLSYPALGHRSRRAFSAVGSALLACASIAAMSVGQPARAATTSPNVGPFHLAWQRILNDPGNPIALASPSVATLDSKGPAMIVGDRAGYVYAYHLSDGTSVAGWPYYTGGIPVDSTASVIGSGPGASIYLGVGNAANEFTGGYVKLTGAGRLAWSVHPKFQPTGAATVGVQNSLAVGNLQGQPAVVSGAMGQMEYAMDAATGRSLTGFPWFEADTAFSTPALADLYGTGRPMIIEGGDSTAGLAFEKQYANGGHLRILSPTGNAGGANPASGLFCEFNTDQVAQSSPAVGRTLRGGRTGITFGTGTFYAGARDTNTLFTVDDRCRKVWSADLGGSTGSSPALADNLGTGELNVIEAAQRSNGVSVFALHGSNGARIWRTDLPSAVYGSVTTVSLNGRYQDVLVPTTGGLYVLDGRSGAVLYRLWKNTLMAMQSTPLVSVDANGAVGVTMTGYKLIDGQLHGAIDHYQITGAPASKVYAPGSWPMFHHDTHLTGNASIAQPTGIRFNAETVGSSSSALNPERGAQQRRQCLTGGACVTLRVEGRTSTGAANFGTIGLGYGSVVLDRSSAGAASVAGVAVNSVLFGTSRGWVTHSAGAMRRAVGAGVSTGGYDWIGGCSTSWKVQMSYSVFFKDGQHISATYTGPYFRGFHC